MEPKGIDNSKAMKGQPTLAPDALPASNAFDDGFLDSLSCS